jgi:hypothetical protein
MRLLNVLCVPLVGTCDREQRGLENTTTCRRSNDTLSSPKHLSILYILPK